MNKVAVIILNYKTWEDTLDEAETVHNCCGVDYSNIIIVDNASPNESYKKLSEHIDDGYVLLKSDKNGGYAAGNNIALRYAYEKGYRYAWILNNDIIINDSDIIKKMIRVMEKDSSVAVINPDIYSPEGHLFNRDAVRPSFFDLTIGMLLYKKKGRKLVDQGGYGYIYRPQGCCMLCDLKKMESVGFMDEHTFLYCEEIILAERLRKENYRCACCSESSVVHNHSKTVSSNIKKKEILKIKEESFKYYLREYRNYGVFRRCIASWFDILKWRMLG